MVTWKASALLTEGADVYIGDTHWDRQAADLADVLYRHAPAIRDGHETLPTDAPEAHP
jgi:hypothetical protein